MKARGIKVEGRTGTWYVVDQWGVRGKQAYLLESEQFGDEADWIRVNESGEEIEEVVEDEED